MGVTTGLDVLVSDPALLRGRRWALLANQAAVTAGLEPAWLALAASAGQPARLFGPEHGLCHFFSPEDVAKIHTRPDEMYRRKVI